MVAQYSFSPFSEQRIPTDHGKAKKKKDEGEAAEDPEHGAHAGDDEEKRFGRGRENRHAEVRTYMLSATIEEGFIQFYFKQRPSRPDYTGDGPLDVRIPNDCFIRFVLDPDLHWSFRHEFDPRRAKNLACIRDALEDLPRIGCEVCPDPPNDIFYEDPKPCKGCAPNDPNLPVDDSAENDAVTLDPTCKEGLYYNLRHISDREVMFYAKKWTKPKDDRYDSDLKVKKKRCILRHFGYPVREEPKDELDWDPFNIYVELDVLAASMVRDRPRKRYAKRLILKIDPDIKNPGDHG